MSVGIYVHIPFCVKKCNYCDFNSSDKQDHLKKPYVEALLAELEESAYEEQADSVFIGGGTPTALELCDLLAIIDQVKKKFPLNQAEFTVEVNPATLNLDGFVALKQAGVNRISLGLQSTNDDELQTLGRIHTYEQFKQSFSLARQAGFGNINVDLMFSIPNQSFATWEHSLKQVVALGPEHISCYSLIVEENTPFAQMPLNLPDEEGDRRNYDYAVSYLTGSGYGQYEISNFAKKGYPCRHNLKYWHRDNYIGFGAGASSLYKNVRFSNTADTKEYIACNDRAFEVLTRKDCINETIMLSLRTTEGVDLNQFKQTFGLDFAAHYAAQIKKYRGLGLMELGHTHCYLTLSGFSVSNSIIADLIE